MQLASHLQILSNVTTPVPGENGADFQDAGLKAVNYRNQPTSAPIWLQNKSPSTDAFYAIPGTQQMLRIVSGLDKSRPQSFHLHGHAWLDQLKAPQHGVSSVNNAISTGGSVNDEFTASNSTGDWVYRAGWLNAEYLIENWGIFRVHK